MCYEIKKATVSCYNAMDGSGRCVFPSSLQRPEGVADFCFDTDRYGKLLGFPSPAFYICAEAEGHNEVTVWPQLRNWSGMRIACERPILVKPSGYDHAKCTRMPVYDPEYQTFANNCVHIRKLPFSALEVLDYGTRMEDYCKHCQWWKRTNRVKMEFPASRKDDPKK